MRGHPSISSWGIGWHAFEVMDGTTLERERELARLQAALHAAAGGDGALVVIEGPPGIGKTHLVETARALAKADGFGRLKAIGDEPERSVPWGVVRQLVERSVLRYSGATREAILAGPAGDALAAIDRAAGADPDDAEFARTLHALWWVAADLAADRPLLITIDDAQWADAPSLRFVAYLARRIADLPIALVVATRPPGADAGPLTDLTAGRTGERLVPQPLSPAALAVYVSARGGAQAASEVVAALHAASGGNPFLAGQLLEELGAAGHSPQDPSAAASVRELGPRTVSRALLARLSDDARALAGAAAVLGARADASAAAALANLSDAAADTAADELRRDHVVEAAATELEFVHPVIREAILGELPPARRGALHAAAARRLHAQGAAADRVAAHLVDAPDGTLPDAPAVLHTAARTLLAEGDARTAVGYLRRALAQAPGDDAIAAALGRALLRAARPDDARRLLREALAATADPRQRAIRTALAAEATLEVDGPEAAVAELRAALQHPSAQEEPARLILEARLAGLCTFLPAERERSGERLAAYGDRRGDSPEERMLLALLAQWCFGAADDAAGVAELVQRALGDGAFLRSGAGDVLAWGQALHAAVFADGLEVVETELAQARASLLPRGAPVDFAAVAFIEALAAWRVGDVARCELEAASGLDALALADPSALAAALRATCTRFHVLASLERGEIDVAAAVLDAWDRAVPEQTPVVVAARVRGARAALALAREDPATALREARALGAAEAEIGDNPAIAWRVPAALAALRLGDDATARELAAEQLTLARRWGAATDVGAALRLMARVGDEDRIDVLQDAVAVLEASPGRLELAAALCDLGEALRVERRRREAHAPLERAAELAEACGARVVAARALDSLAALGDRPRRLAFSGADALTASERRVAALAAAGRSNREIAHELFVTPKTVENHLGRVYGKLGIGGRRELRSVLTTA